MGKPSIAPAAFFIFFVALILLLALRSTVPSESHIYEPPEIKENVLSDLIQKWRRDNKLKEFRSSPNLCEFANHRLDMVQIHFSHDGFVDYSNEKKYYGYDILMENLSKDYPSEQEMLDKWLASPLHLKNLESEAQDACLKCKNNYCVHIFGEMLGR